MENASSSCWAMRLMRAEASRSRMRGSLNCDRGRGGEQERGGGGGERVGEGGGEEVGESKLVVNACTY